MSLSRINLFARSLLFAVLVTVVTIIWAILCFFFSPLPYRKRYYLTTRWCWMTLKMARYICGIRYRIKGYENLPDAPVILLSKHQSAWETIFYTIAMPRPMVYVFKKELLYIPFFGWGIGLLRMIPIDRSRGKDAFAQVVANGRKRLANGMWIIMFPEGTRIPVGQQGRYKAGGTRLAVETGTPVVPIAVNSGEFWPKNSFIKTPGTITVSIGKPIPAAGRDPAELLAEVERWIETEMRVISPHAYPPSEHTPSQRSA